MKKIAILILGILLYGKTMVSCAQLDTTKQKSMTFNLSIGIYSGVNKYSISTDSYYNINNSYGSLIGTGVGVEFLWKNRYSFNLGTRLTQRRGTSIIDSKTDGFFLNHYQTNIELPLTVGFKVVNKSEKEFFTIHTGGFYSLVYMETTANNYYIPSSYYYIRGGDPRNGYTTNSITGLIKLSKNMVANHPIQFNIFCEFDFQIVKFNKGTPFYFIDAKTNEVFKRDVNLLTRSTFIGFDIVF